MEDGTVLVRPHDGFVPKDSEERAIPIPRGLAEQLRALPKVNGSELLFPNHDGSRCMNLRRNLYKTVARAGLDRKDFWCHRFPATWATRLLQGGLDIRTVVRLAGHSKIETTDEVPRCLRPHCARAEDRSHLAIARSCHWIPRAGSVSLFLALKSVTA